MPALSTAITGGPGESCAAGLLTLPAFPATFPSATLATFRRCLGRQLRCENERPFQPGGRLSAVRARGYSSGALPFSMYAGDYRLWGKKSQFQGRRGERSVVGARRGGGDRGAVVGFDCRPNGGFEGRHKACPYRGGFGDCGSGAWANGAGTGLGRLMFGTGWDWGAGGMQAVEEAPGGIPAPGG